MRTHPSQKEENAKDGISSFLSPLHPATEEILVNFDQSASPASLNDNGKEVVPAETEKPIIESGPTNLTSDRLR